MKKIKIKNIKVLISFALIFSFAFGSVTASAKTIQSSPYLGYDFDSDNTSVPAPNGYEAEQVISSHDMGIDMGFGKASAVDYDGTDMEQPFCLVNIGSKVLRTDVSYHVVASYDINVGQGKKVVLNDTNGYLFVTAGDKVNIYNTSSQFVKSITASDVGLSVFTPKTVLHVGDGIDNYIYIMSGTSCVVLDGEGIFVETISFDDPPIDIYYNTASMCFYALFSDKIVNVTEEIEIPLPFSVSADSRMVADVSGMTFYVMTGSKVYQFNDMGEEIGLISPQGNATDISYNVDKDRLVVLTDAGDFSVSLYASGEYINTIDGYQTSIHEPQDMLYLGEYLYILDSGNGRILKMNSACTSILDIYESFIYENQKLSIKNAEGMWIDGDRLFIADTEHERVVISNFEGIVETILTKPENLKGLTNPFGATKVLTDREGNIYVICESVNMGAFLFSKDYEFKNFFGSNTIATTGEAIANYIKKKMLNKTQRSFLSNITPVTLANFDIDEDGFIYIVTEVDSLKINRDFTGMIRKVNYLGSDILGNSSEEPEFGDYEWDRQFIITNTSFGDVDVNDGGWIVALDLSRGKLFQYSKNGDFITAFGGRGEQVGMFKMPTAVENIGDKVYVLDGGNNSITIFEPTDYLLALQEAFLHMNSADLDTSVSLWNKVLKSNSNSGYAYYGLGIAYENAGMYEEAMENYKLADAKAQYSKAFKAYRKEVLNNNLIWVVLILTVAIALFSFGTKKLLAQFVKREGEAHAPIESKWGMPIYALVHPFDGFQQFRTRGLYSVPISGGIVAGYFLISVLQYFGTGFIFNENKAINYNILSTLTMTVLIYVLFVVSNLAISTFMDGKGKFPYILSVTAYAMIPMLIASLVNVGLSNVLSLDEEVFMTIIMVVGYLWSGFVLLIGMIEIHEYSVTKTVLSLVFTVVAMIIFAVIGLLLIMLMQQITSFIGDIIYEAGLR